MMERMALETLRPCCCLWGGKLRERKRNELLHKAFGMIHNPHTFVLDKEAVCNCIGEETVVFFGVASM